MAASSDDSIKKVTKNTLAAPALAAALAGRLRGRHERLAVAESCTGGLIAKLLTDLPGSSDWFERGLVTYSNRAKQDLLGVPETLIERHGAVSRQTALAMATGLQKQAPVDWTLAVTGIAGPGGGGAKKPVGLVWIAAGGRREGARAKKFLFQGSRRSVRTQAAVAALHLLLKRLK